MLKVAPGRRVIVVFPIWEILVPMEVTFMTPADPMMILLFASVKSDSVPFWKEMVPLTMNPVSKSFVVGSFTPSTMSSFPFSPMTMVPLTSTSA